MKTFKQIIILLLLSFSGFVYALDQFIIKNIRVVGLQRIEIGTVFSYLPVKSGDLLTKERADEIITRLYATGFFTDVRVEEQNNTLIIGVLERPIISTLTVTGDHAFDHDLLLKSLKTNGLADGRIFDQSALDQAILSLKSEYYNRGLYSVVIVGKVVSLERNRVAVNITIDEHENAKIAAITFVGNRVFSADKLSSLMFLNTGGWFSFWYKDNQYSNDKLTGDIEAIRIFYLNQGYINFKINSIQVQLSVDKQSVYVTINVSEGQQYRIGEITIGGDIKDVPQNELQSQIKIVTGDIVNQTELNRVVDNLKFKLGEYGYAFADVRPIPEVNNKARTVKYTLFVDAGKKIYIRQINISGNEKTRDIVVRRELRQTENSLYNSKQIKRSKERLNQTGYFKSNSVDVATEPVVGTPNVADMNIKVEEENTGDFRFGIGYAQNMGLLLNGTISQRNLFGSGKYASLSASTNQLNQDINLSFTDPYALPNGTNLGYDLYSDKYAPNQAGISPYQTQTLGARMRTQIPVSEYDRISFSLGFENQQVALSDNSSIPLKYLQFVNQYGNSVDSVPFSVGWSRNTSDSMMWPTSGAIFSETFDMSLPNVGPQYYRFTSQETWFVSLHPKLTWKINAQAGFINPYSNSNAVPFYKNYYAGGITSLRGYVVNTLGPKDTDATALGGTREMLLLNDFLFPMPGIKDERSVRLGAFFDMGTLWGGNNFNLNAALNFRASYGAEIIWISPLVPIKMSYALPLFNQPNDSLQAFQFMVGSSF